MKRIFLSLTMVAVLLLSGCLPGSKPVITPPAATAPPPLLPSTPDSTKIALEIAATGMSSFITQQAATLFSPTQTPPARPPSDPDCSSGRTRLKVDGFAVVSEENRLPNRVREGPDNGAAIISQIYPGTILRVLEGPVCAGSMVFWKVENKSIPGGAGWTAETEGTDHYLEPYPPLALEATDSPLVIAGGTYLDSGAGLMGTGFVFSPALTDGRTIGHIAIQGPPGWNADRAFQLYPYQPPDIAGDRATGWVFATPITGTYTATAGLTDGGSVSTPFAIDVASHLPAPEILSVSGSTSQVRVDWSGTAAMRSFLVRLEREPFATDTSFITERVVEGEGRSLTFGGLSLTSGVVHRVVIFAFSNDLHTPGAVTSPANLSADVSDTFTP